MKKKKLKANGNEEAKRICAWLELNHIDPPPELVQIAVNEELKNRIVYPLEYVQLATYPHDIP